MRTKPLDPKKHMSPEEYTHFKKEMEEIDNAIAFGASFQLRKEKRQIQKRKDQ